MKVFYLFLFSFILANTLSGQYDANHNKVFHSLEEALEENPTRVYYLDLKQKELKTFPKEVLQFTNLIHLNLAHNSIRSLDGVDLSMLTDLEDIILYDNDIRIFPYEALAKATNLKILDLGENDLKAIDENINQLKYLEELELSGNRIATIAENVKLRYLTSIKLDRNYLHDFPSFIFKASKLAHLNLYGNQLTAIPETLNTLSKINYLNIGDNPLQSIAANIKLRKLKTLIVDWVDLSKPALNIDFAKRSTAIETLSMEHCQLVEIPSFVFALRKLKEFSILNNEIRRIDTKIANNKKLIKCWVSGNYIEDKHLLALQQKMRKTTFIN